MEMRFAPFDERRGNLDEDSLAKFPILETPRVKGKSAIGMNLLDLT